eukprot:5388240-Amphidinium_carterae.2
MGSLALSGLAEGCDNANFGCRIQEDKQIYGLDELELGKTCSLSMPSSCDTKRLQRRLFKYWFS